MGGWRFGNTIDGCLAEYVLVPNASANLAAIPDGLTDEQVLMCPDIMSTGFSGAESGAIRIGDTVAVFAQGPIGLCATAGAKLRGATTIIAVDTLPERLAMAQRMGADIVIDYRKTDPVAEILRLTGKPASLIKRVADRPGHDRRYSIECSKAQALGWAPRRSFAEALAETVEWYRGHDAWWRPLKSGEFKAYYQRQYANR